MTSRYQDPEYAMLPRAQRERVELLINTIASKRPSDAITKAGGMLERIMRVAACSIGNARRMYYAFAASSDWRDLCDKRSMSPIKIASEGARSTRFHAWVQCMCESRQRSTQQAIDFVHNALRYGRDIVPGFESWNYGQGLLPMGVSATALRKMIKRDELASARQGYKTDRRHELPVLTTRRGLAVGSIYEIDDVWHDHLVVAGSEQVRVLEFGALDIASGCRIHWGHTPFVRKEDGKRQGLTQKMFVLFVAYILRYVGYSEDGVTLKMEHGTASMSKRARELLETSGCGIKICMGGITGAAQSKLGGYQGQMGGNPRSKARIEASHSGLHNMLDALPGQVGLNRHKIQESTYGRIAEQELLEKWKGIMLKNGQDDLAAALENHFLTLNQFSNMLLGYYQYWNMRTEHQLEGWDDHHEIEFELSAGHWMRSTAIQMTDLLAEQIRLNPRMAREVKMSPQSVWQHKRGGWKCISMALYLDLIGDAAICGHVVRVSRRMLCVQDKLISSDKIYFLADIVSPDGRHVQLEEGCQYHCILNPYALESLIITDASGRILGEAPQYKRAAVHDIDAVHEVMGRTMSATMTQRARQQIRHSDETTRVEQLRAHNRNLAVAAGIVHAIGSVPARGRKKKIAAPKNKAVTAAISAALPSSRKRRSIGI